jgi:ATP-dependent HslUV protease subunit HslV
MIGPTRVPDPRRRAGPRLRSTTILAVRHRGGVVIAGDGQVSLGQTVLKQSARKVRRLFHDRVLAGFAGSSADALTLFEKFEAALEAHSGNLKRAAVTVAKDWRGDRVLRRLEALMIVADREASLLLSGGGDIIESDDGLLAIGSGGNYALAAARALVRHTALGAREIAEEALRTAAEICVFTNDRLVVEELPCP